MIVRGPWGEGIWRQGVISDYSLFLYIYPKCAGINVTNTHTSGWAEIRGEETERKKC